MTMLRHLSFFTILLFALAFPIFTLAQGNCFSSYNQSYLTGYTCYTTPLTLTAAIPCNGCAYTWTGGPLIAGQGTPTTTYQWSNLNGWGHVYTFVDLDVYNPGQNCYYGEMWDVSAGAKPNIALPALSNGPWNGDTSKTWIYTRNYLDPAPQTSGSYSFYPTWTVTGGTVTRQRHYQQSIFYYDSVYVKWNGSANMTLIESQLTMHSPPIVLSYNCNWNPTPYQIPYPSLAIFYNGSICTGAPKNFFTFPFAGSTYTWSTTNGSVVSGQGTNSAQILLSGPATVTVVRDSSGTITTTNISVTPVSSVINLGPDQTVCAGTSVTLNAGAGYTNYLWSTGATTQSINVTTPGIYHVTANINGGCNAQDTIQITHLPVTQVNLGPDIHTCTFPVTLDAGPGFTAYNWSTGATTQTISANFAGNFSVTVTNPNGCTASDAVIVYNSQVGIAMPPNHTFCHPGSLTIIPTYTNASSYLWSTGATSAGITVTTPGTQGFAVTASNVYGCSATAFTNVTSLPRPTPSMGPDQTICPGTSTTFDAGPGYTAYVWSPFSTSQAITAANPGTYRVTVTAANGCTGSDTAQLFHYPFTAPNFGPDINVCQPSTSLDAGPGYATYLWNTGATTQTITVTTTGNYSVTVTDANGCLGSDAINVTFSTFSFTLGPDVTTCEPNTVLLDPQLTGNFTYTWSNGATSPTVTLTTAGIHNITLTASNTFGCTASDTVVAAILPTPASPLGNDTILCADTTITLDMGPAFASYAWSTGATTSSITVPNGGVYTITATASNGCVRLDTVLISDLIDCVFPGDVNYDNGVDLLDVLALGTVMGQTGPARTNPSINFYGQQCMAWIWNVALGVNSKQADTDGNGTITQNDTLAIQQNFGLTHTRTGAVGTMDGNLRIVPLNPNVTAGDLAQFAVILEGDGATNLDSVHGLALNLTWPTTGLATPGLISIHYANAWFAPAGNHLDFTRTAGNAAQLAISRTSGTDTSGQGQVLILTFATDSSLAPGNQVSFSPTATLAQVVGEGLTTRVVPSTSTPALIQGTVSMTPGINAHLLIWPIPADGIINIDCREGNMPETLRLINMLGQTVIDLPTHGEKQITLDVAALPEGTYLLQLRLQDRWITKKISINHL
jgi:hypothetical protein